MTKPTEDDQDKSKVRKESDSTIPDPSHQTVTSTPLVIAPFIDVSSTKPSLLVTPPPINTEATTITSSLLEITPFIALQLRVARLEQEMSEVKKTDHSADVLASIKSQVPMAVDKYLGTKIDDALLRRVKVKGIIKRKHDSDNDEDDDDDEGPSAGSNQGKSSKRRRHDSGASGSAQPPTKDDEQSSKKPRESDASASKQHPALTSTGWQITDTRDAVVDSSMPRSDTESEHSEQSSDDIPMQDEGHVSDLEDTDNAHIPKVSTTTRTGKKKLCKADLEGPAFNLVKAFHKNNVFLQYQMDECHKLLTNKVDLSNPEGHQILRNIYEPLPLGGPPGQVKSECDYDISAVYGITHWWFRRKEFYINKHSEPSDRKAVRSQMRILNMISVKVFEKYGYNYLREIILRRADYQEYKISEKDFKSLHPNDFEDLFLLNIQEKLNHLPKTDKTSLYTAVNMWIRNLVIRNRVGDLQLGIESYQTKINLECLNWDTTDYYLQKTDYPIVTKQEPLVTETEKFDPRKLMRLE
ncbi:hypothetical protein Tco_0819063 [Tanacetum coccineum]|uniref:Uncharacterized protein n=1 Tax=Tanacetum coccineum TaxID=301880 RepID=A0ABQ5AA34_9ASTR